MTRDELRASIEAQHAEQDRLNREAQTAEAKASAARSRVQEAQQREWDAADERLRVWAQGVVDAYPQVAGMHEAAVKAAQRALEETMRDRPAEAIEAYLKLRQATNEGNRAAERRAAMSGILGRSFPSELPFRYSEPLSVVLDRAAERAVEARYYGNDTTITDEMQAVREGREP